MVDLPAHQTPSADNNAMQNRRKPQASIIMRVWQRKFEASLNICSDAEKKCNAFLWSFPLRLLRCRPAAAGPLSVIAFGPVKLFCVAGVPPDVLICLSADLRRMQRWWATRQPPASPSLARCA
jgi:hypothetical protein